MSPFGPGAPSPGNAEQSRPGWGPGVGRREKEEESVGARIVQTVSQEAEELQRGRKGGQASWETGVRLTRGRERLGHAAQITRLLLLAFTHLTPISIIECWSVLNINIYFMFV